MGKNKLNSGLIFMKVGVHDGEPFEEIIERKKREIDKAGMSFWGYGGATCHPHKQVQPFVKYKVEEGENIYLVMEEINSNHQVTGKIASQFSIDGLNWSPIPDGIEVRGSKYAIVLGEIEEGDLDINLSHYRVGFGPNKGKSASNYIQGRVDKGCIERISDKEKFYDIPRDIKKISHFGKMINPYAVSVK